ncbi:Ribonuclease H [Quillaja saponaria]|uniref:Ribonuclease H n=1 Tax=Quillaja saponaria TaxID=32244 RepID=A0AAD7LTH0_QUISA|nr:Ribonuclease H [Quillaja saponaria]
MKVSTAKYKIMVSANTPRKILDEISSFSPIGLTTDLGKYLGVPLLHSRVNKETYREMCDKVQAKLSGWKRDQLSLAGKAMLIQASSSAVPIYTMMTTKIPNSVCAHIDKIQRSFLWGDSEVKKKVHLVNWRQVCLPKTMGGLGLKDMNQVNLSLLAKLGWRLIRENYSLWAKVLQGKYFHDKQFLTTDVKPYNSFTWKSIMKGCEVLKQGIKWRLGNGEDIEFWNDIWLDNFILRELAINLVPVEHLQWKVSEYIFDGKWKLNILRGLLPDHILASLEAIDLQVCCSWKDKVIWKLSSDGKFSTSSARSLIRGTPPSVDLSIFKKIWRIQTLPRIKFFVWLAYLNKLLTNDLRWKRKMVDLPSCSLCSSLVEDVLHAVRDCSHVSQIWQKMVPSFMQSSFFSANLNDWFILNLNYGVLFRDTIPWPTVFFLLGLEILEVEE